MGKVLGIVNRAISAHLINKAGFKVTQAHTGAVTLNQRFGSALNLNLHFHVLFIDGVYSPKSNGELRFHRVNAPTSKELNALIATISERVARYLERQGWLARDEQSDYLTLRGLAPFHANSAVKEPFNNHRFTGGAKHNCLFTQRLL